ncbi:MAG: CHASE2 domain-containing protein [Ignavibacterium album]|uniref:CHASE2 domain-containing protein n=1 Tax=Ignavibacterium album TaxID=591197 RepID=UPI0026F13F77|nr:CHASE2 domain-containing protein [Ignavibacterium album]MCX8105479.1 CHASE2 domain-containing protein [Ignavibacterium album]
MFNQNKSLPKLFLWVLLIILWINSFYLVFLSKGISYDYYAYDFLLSNFYKQKKNEIIHYLLITDESYLKVFKRNSIDRKKVAEAILLLEEVGVTQIVFDIIFAHPSSENEDKSLAKCFSQFNNIVLPVGIVEKKSQTVSLFDYNSKLDIESKLHLKTFLSSEYISPLKMFLSRNSILGHINEVTDKDGILRHNRPILKIDSINIPSLALVSFLNFLGDSINSAEYVENSELIINKNLRIPIDENNQTLVPFIDQWGLDFGAITLEDLFELNNTSEGKLKLRNSLSGKIILVADVSSSASDVSPTAISTRSPLVMVHSSMINALLNNKFIRKSNVQENILSLNLVLLILFASFHKKRRIFFALNFIISLSILIIISILMMFFGVFLYSISILISLAMAFTLGFILMESIFLNEKRIIELDNYRKSFEMNETRLILQQLIPENHIEFFDYSISFYLKSAEEVGGDFFDYFIKNDEMTIFVADGSGHGLQAGVLVVSLKSIISSLQKIDNPSLILNQINKILRKIRFNKLFLCLSVLKIRNDLIVYSVAGLPPILHYVFEENVINEYHTKNIPLGFKDEFNFSESSFIIKKNDLVCIFTDGLIELFNKRKELLGMQRVKRTLQEKATSSPKEIVSEFKNLISEWKDNTEQSDDISFVIIKKN